MRKIDRNYLGFAQLGDTVVLSVTTLDLPGGIVVPDDVPTARVYRGTHFVEARRVPVLDRYNQHGRFQLPLFLGPAYQLGYHSVLFSYAVSGVALASFVGFTIKDGGDSGGGLISMVSYRRPETQYIVAQLQSGRLVSGRSPTI